MGSKSCGIPRNPLRRASGWRTALEGAFAGDIAFVSSEGGDMCYNPDVAEALGVTIPEADLARGIDVTQQ